MWQGRVKSIKSTSKEALKLVASLRILRSPISRKMPYLSSIDPQRRATYRWTLPPRKPAAMSTSCNPENFSLVVAKHNYSRSRHSKLEKLVLNSAQARTSPWGMRTMLLVSSAPSRVRTLASHKLKVLITTWKMCSIPQPLVARL